MREHLSDEQKLDLLWNDLVGGHGGVPQDDVDRSIAETVHALQALAKSPPESESQARVDRAVLAAIEQRAREPDKSPAPDDAVSAAHRNYPFGSNGNGQLADLKDMAGRRRTSAVRDENSANTSSGTSASSAIPRSGWCQRTPSRRVSSARRPA